MCAVWWAGEEGRGPVLPASHFYEEVLRRTWTPVARLPIYETGKSKWPTQDYGSDAVRAMRLYHNRWRHILGSWKERTETNSLVTFHYGSSILFVNFESGQEQMAKSD